MLWSWGKALGVRYLLEGSVRKAGDQVRINVHLIDSSDWIAKMWADDFVGRNEGRFFAARANCFEDRAVSLTSSSALKNSRRFST